MNNKILVVVAHPDDEVLGCGGTIAKHAKDNDQIELLILADGESSRSGVKNIDIKKRIIATKNSANILGINNIEFAGLNDNRLDKYNRLDIIQIVEKKINDFEPNIVYTHDYGDLNVDHSITNQSVLTCCRSTPNQIVKKLFSFEILSSSEWQINDSSFLFKPNYYVNITEELDKKLEALKAYSMEIRDWPHPRSLKGVTTLANLRGCQAGFDSAEAFSTLRYVVC